MNLQSVFDIAEICAKKGVKRAIISPGSRNAPLTIGFNRHPDIECVSVSDERSAAFIGLGMALKSGEPTALICTSGSAAYNYAPAVAEAFFNQVPLLILTADRPPEWIGQKDGQTIYQEYIYGRHVKRSFSYPALDEHEVSTWHGHRMISEAINLCNQHPKGPTHVNVPLREPFYPKEDQAIRYSQKIKIINQDQVVSSHQLSIPDGIQKVLIVVGQRQQDTELTEVLNRLSTAYKIPVICDIISNQHEVAEAVIHQDLFLKNNENELLKPELVITCGLSVISKNLKLFLRNCPDLIHWHIGPEYNAPDTFQKLTKQIFADPIATLKELQFDGNNTYYQNWQAENLKAAQVLSDTIDESYNEVDIYRQILSSLPSNLDLHLANSLAVRYANFVGLKDKQQVEIFCNRGTSGIDGSNSTAVGTSIVAQKETILLTGDVAFFYDRNAFWHNLDISHLKIIIFNNHGGGIFRMIEGPSDQPELKEYFETQQKSSAIHLAREFDFNYLSAGNEEQLQASLSEFLQLKNKKAILEIFTDPAINKTAFKKMFHKMSEIRLD